MKKIILSLLVALMATTGAWADNLYLEVSGTTATLKYGDKGDNPYYYNSYGTMYWSSSADDAKSTVTTINVHTSCASHDLTKLQNLFNYFTALETINGLENLKTTGVTNMTFMFGSCGNLTAVDVSGFNTASVEDMQNMFYNCDELVTLDLSGWNTGSVTDMSNMFSGCTDLVNIYVGNDWSVTNVKWDSNMFYNCVSLPGYNSSYVDKTRAHTGDGGYLKTKPAPAGPTTSGITWNTGTNSGTFLMPAYDVEVSTELWYLVSETKTLAENIDAYGTKSDFFLNRTLTAGVWNTFASPFAIAAADMEKYFGAGAKVRQLGSTEVDGTVLTLNFEDATSIVAGQPYLVKPAVNVDFSADGKEFAGVNLNAATATTTEKTHVDFVPTLGKTLVEGDVKDILILNTSGTLVHPSEAGLMKGFRGYFVMHEAASLARAFRIDFGDGEATGIQPIRMENGTTPAEGTYDLSGRRIQGQPTQKGVYIQNGKKVVIK